MGATNSEFDKLRINDAIFQVVFKDVIAEGMTSFDFEPSPKVAAGLERFKRNIGWYPSAADLCDARQGICAYLGLLDSQHGDWSEVGLR
jgi:hypothetical protein